MTDVLRWVGAGLLLVACGADDEAYAFPRTAEPTPHAPAESPAASSPSPASHDAAETRARSEAEAFVRAQGYADTPPTVPDDAIVHEGIEGSIEMRRNSLVPEALSAERNSDGWVVRFRYVDPRYAGRGRALHLREGQPPGFMHQDVLLGP